MIGRRLRKIGNIALEQMISDYFKHFGTEDGTVDVDDLAEFIAGRTYTTPEEVKKIYRRQLDNVVKSREKCDDLECEVTESFRKFLSRKKRRWILESLENLTIDELEHDRVLKAYRNSTSYKNADLEEKSKMIWKYLVKTYSDRIDDDANVKELCDEIADKDERKF